MIKYFCDRCKTEVKELSRLHPISLKRNESEGEYGGTGNYQMDKLPRHFEFDVCASCWVDIHNFVADKPKEDKIFAG
jgi:hypothetical protein